MPIKPLKTEKPQLPGVSHQKFACITLGAMFLIFDIYAFNVLMNISEKGLYKKYIIILSDLMCYSKKIKISLKSK